MPEEIGCVGVAVVAKPEALAFYLSYGFEQFSVLEGALLARPEPTPMFLSKALAHHLAPAQAPRTPRSGTGRTSSSFRNDQEPLNRAWTSI